MKKTITHIALAHLLFAIFNCTHAQSWNTTGNAGTSASTNFIGTTDNVNFKIRTNNVVRMNITNNGKVAIGNYTPVFKLDVKGGSINTDSLYRIGGLAVLSVTGTNNTFVGTLSGIGNGAGNDNTACGYESLKNNTTGDYNSSYGSGALANNISGYYNVAMGSNALRSNLIGDRNIALGYEANKNNVAGSGGIAIGIRAMLHSDTTSLPFNNSNIAIGNDALYGSINLSQNTGQMNTCIGQSALNLNSSGSRNTASGYGALSNNSTGADNSGFGYFSCENNSAGNKNTAMGAGSCLNNNSGNNNTAVGYAALVNNTNGSNNTALGYYANVVYGANLDNATAIGANANVIQSNSLVLGDTTNVSVGIGTGAPKAKLHIKYTSSPGTPQILLSETTNNLARIGFSNSNTTNIFTVNGYPAAANANAKFIVSYLSDLFTVQGDGKVGIGTTIPAYQLQLSTNSAAKPTSSAWTVPSDMRLKKDVKAFTDGIEILNQINPVWFTYTGDAGMPANDKGIGTIAQELQKVAPYMVNEWTYRNEKDNSEQNYLGVDYGAMDFILVNSVKQQQKQIEIRDKKIETLESRMNELENALSQCCSSFQSSRNSLTESFTDFAKLEQNNPNPFTQNTMIKFYVPQNATTAFVKIYSLDGVELKSFTSTQKGVNEIRVAGNSLAAGVYVYTLVIDGKTIDTKQMILTR